MRDQNNRRFGVIEIPAAADAKAYQINIGWIPDLVHVYVFDSTNDANNGVTLRWNREQGNGTGTLYRSVERFLVSNNAAAGVGAASALTQVRAEKFNFQISEDIIGGISGWEQFAHELVHKDGTYPDPLPSGTEIDPDKLPQLVAKAGSGVRIGDQFSPPGAKAGGAYRSTSPGGGNDEVDTSHTRSTGYMGGVDVQAGFEIGVVTTDDINPNASGNAKFTAATAADYGTNKYVVKGGNKLFWTAERLLFEEGLKESGGQGVVKARTVPIALTSS